MSIHMCNDMIRVQGHGQQKGVANIGHMQHTVFCHFGALQTVACKNGRKTVKHAFEIVRRGLNISHGGLKKLLLQISSYRSPQTQLFFVKPKNMQCALKKEMVYCSRLFHGNVLKRSEQTPHRSVGECRLHYPALSRIIPIVFLGGEIQNQSTRKSFKTVFFSASGSILHRLGSQFVFWLPNNKPLFCTVMGQKNNSKNNKKRNQLEDWMITQTKFIKTGTWGGLMKRCLVNFWPWNLFGVVWDYAGLCIILKYGDKKEEYFFKPDITLHLYLKPSQIWVFSFFSMPAGARWAACRANPSRPWGGGVQPKAFFIQNFPAFFRTFVLKLFGTFFNFF